MPESFRSLAQILAEEPALKKVRENMKKYDIVDEFRNIFPQLANIAEPVKTEKKQLLLRVENSVWRNELKLNEPIIVEKVNKYFNEERITGIKFIA